MPKQKFINQHKQLPVTFHRESAQTQKHKLAKRTGSKKTSKDTGQGQQLKRRLSSKVS